LAIASIILGLTHSYAHLLATEGITVKAIAPALIETEMVTGNPNARLDLIPVGRFGTVEEVAGRKPPQWLPNFCKRVSLGSPWPETKAGVQQAAPCPLLGRHASIGGGHRWWLDLVPPARSQVAAS